MPRPAAPRIALIGFPILEKNPNPNSEALARYIMDQQGWELVLAAEGNVAAIQLIPKMRCDGALIRILDQPMARAARALQVPVVNISSWLRDTGVVTVRRDDRAVGELAAEHLLQKNFRRFACLHLPLGDFIDERIRGFVARVAPIDPAPAHFRFRSMQPTITEQKKFALWLQQLTKPIGLLLPDDSNAPLLFDLCQRAGVRLPAEIGVIAASIHPEAILHCRPRLSHVVTREDQIYFRAVDVLAQMLRRRAPVSQLEEVKPSGVQAEESTRRTVSDDPLVDAVLQWIDEHLQEPINVNALCQRFRVARSTLEKRFKAALHRPPITLLSQARVERAQVLLRDSPHLSLEQVARQCGLTSRKRLNLVFTAQVGLSPKAWREQNTPGRRLQGKSD